MSSTSSNHSVEFSVWGTRRTCLRICMCSKVEEFLCDRTSVFHFVWNNNICWLILTLVFVQGFKIIYSRPPTSSDPSIHLGDRQQKGPSRKCSLQVRATIKQLLSKRVTRDGRNFSLNKITPLLLRMGYTFSKKYILSWSTSRLLVLGTSLEKILPSEIKWVVFFCDHVF